MTFTMKSLYPAVIALVCCVTFPARADVNAIRAMDTNELWGALGASMLNYKEPLSPPTIPDSERGVMPSVAGGFNTMLPQDIYLGFDAAGTFGDAHYHGALVATPTVPLDSTTRESIVEVNGKIGKGFPIANSVMLIPYADLGYRYWNRDLGHAQIEEYDHFEGSGGLMAQAMMADNLMLTLYGSGGTTFYAHMNTSGLKYDLADRGVYKAGGKLAYNLTPNLELFTTLDFNTFHYGKSQIQTNSTYEPNSWTVESAARLGLGWHFSTR